MKDVPTVLELDIVKNRLSDLAFLSFTKKRINDLTYSTDYYHIEEELEKTEEALSITNAYGRCPIEFIHDLRKSLDKASKQGVLLPEELYRIGSQTSGVLRIKSFLKIVDEEKYKHFAYYVNTLVPLKDLQARIDKCITPNFEIYDNASSTLAKIRRELISKNLEVRKKLEGIVKNQSSYLSDSLITIRNDRLVVPVKSSYKTVFGGIIHDESQTQQTVYVEPESVILLNSQLMALKQKELVEIERILRELSSLVASEAETLLRNQSMIEEIDFMFAKGSYGVAINGMVAKLSKEQIVSLKGARHPLLDQKTVVANDFFLGGENKKIYLITGPNTGGKTVALKTVGLIALMNQCGLAVPVDFEATLGVFDDFFVDIGDEQSIEQSLSTFSSHMAKLTAMVKVANKKSLVLIDEVGGGTDPSEGEALAMAVINHFHACGSLVLATTHYTNLKTFAIEQGYITNASMVFDRENIKPTYKLNVGISGKSYAFEIAKSLGFPNTLIDRAKEYKQSFMTKTDELIEQLENELTRQASERQKLEEEKMRLEKEALRLQELSAEYQKKEDKLKEEAQESIDKMLKEALDKVENILKDINKKDLKMHEVIKAKADLESLEPETKVAVKKSNDKFEVGDYVLVIAANKKGKIRGNKGNDYLVDMGGLTLRVNKNDLEHTTKAIEEKPIKTRFIETIHVPVELNLIGLHVEEALIALDKYMDDALRVHLKSVRIIHGFGSGALRNAVHKYLKGNRFVKDYHYGGAYDGGMGATIVTFKE